MEVKKCLVEDFIAATTQGATQQTLDESSTVETGEKVNTQGSKSFNWETWDE